MKTIKKLASIALALVMVLCLTAPALATDIEITNQTNDGTDSYETYTAYKVFDVTIGAGDEATAPHSYTISADSPFLSTIQNFKIMVAGTSEGETQEINAFDLTQVGDIYNVDFKGDYNDAEFAVNLAKALNAVEGKDSQIIATTDTQVNGVYTLNIPDPEQGYYFITSTLGSKIIVDTVGKNKLTITSKNEYPTLTKTIESIENGTVATDNKSGTAAYGSTVTFKIDVAIPATAVGEMIVHDVMDADLTYVGLVENAPATEAETKTHEACTVEFVISADTVAENLGNTVTIEYTATLNDGAETATAIKNTAHLTYSEYKTPDSETEVYTYEFDLVKTTSKQTGYKILNGAKFDLYKVVDDVEEVEEDGEIVQKPVKVDVLVKQDIEVGTATISGLSAGDYKLIETVAPEGYNKLNTPVEFSITDTDLKAEVTEATEEAPAAWIAGGVHVENLTGAELPSTGGIGTTIFYIVGGALAVGACILLVTKKRVGAKEE